MCEQGDHTSNFRRVSVQRTSSGRLLAVCVVIPADVVARFVDSDTESISIKFKPTPEGIMMAIGDNRSLH